MEEVSKNYRFSFPLNVAVSCQPDGIYTTDGKKI